MDAYGEIPEIYFTTEGESGLHEAPSTRPSLPAILNARESDGTLVFAAGSVPELCKRIITALRNDAGKYLLVDPRRVEQVPKTVQWIVEQNVKTLNVTGAGSDSDDEEHQKGIAFLEGVVSYVQLHQSRGVTIWTL